MLLFTVQSLYIQGWQFFETCGGRDLHTHYSAQEEPSHHHTMLEVPLVFAPLV